MQNFALGLGGFDIYYVRRIAFTVAVNVNRLKVTIAPA
jgi:hypothetical protein